MPVPHCYGSGDIFNPAGAAENDCETCPVYNACLMTCKSTQEKTKKLESDLDEALNSVLSLGQAYAAHEADIKDLRVALAMSKAREELYQDKATDAILGEMATVLKMRILYKALEEIREGHGDPCVHAEWFGTEEDRHRSWVRADQDTAIDALEAVKSK